ncbi:hypothetical protein SAMN05192583_0502 [Sphingomonas gellani]|uniref:histidine kinase n=1 Tax=Sphingomonas gellani TaxID=1166340 RepID=A0A1H7Z248_9SPHN|nr:HAMP domain-containing sensor histidine kinase [Sphingomonas gellani]SEM52261.1 hypothetical protein SAMN05192583_0502 [Sphingomonas gellani]
MRFDDSLKTVLSSDMSTGFGATAAWRQLVDLVGRGRVTSDDAAIARLRVLRQSVPTAVRSASARGLAYARPDERLVAFFAEDDLAIAAPVLRTADLDADAWLSILPALTPQQRAVLRHRRDLPPETVRALSAFGSVDFVLEDGTPQPRAPIPLAVPAAPEMPSVPNAPLTETPFVALGDVARGLPLVAEAFRQATPDLMPVPPVPTEPTGYAISDLVARIDAFTRQREDGRPSDAPEAAPSVPAATSFRFETDAKGIIRWTDPTARPVLIGLSIAAAEEGIVQVDGAVLGAFRRRTRFCDARLEVEGSSPLAGSWRIGGAPAFEESSGRFIGFVCSARRPRADESADRADRRRPGGESLRQLMHELRTPTHAIAGFAELIESELLGPISPTYRARAGTIRAHAADLLATIEDLDTAARIEGDALELRPAAVAIEPIVRDILADLQPLAALRGTVPLLSVAPDLPAASGDARAVERVIARLLATAISSGASGERIGVDVAGAIGGVSIAIDRPRGLSGVPDGEDALLTLDDVTPVGELMEGVHGVPLLGATFALRLAHNLARELGGALTVGPDRLTLRLPAAVDHVMGQTTTI